MKGWNSDVMSYLNSLPPVLDCQIYWYEEEERECEDQSCGDGDIPSIRVETDLHRNIVGYRRPDIILRMNTASWKYKNYCSIQNIQNGAEQGSCI